MVFDKTGTLTVGRPSVTDVVPTGRLSSDELLHLAASAEKGSEHPLGEAIVNAATIRSIGLSDPQDFEAVAGKGVKAKVDGATVLLGNRRLITENGGDLSKVEPELSRLEGEGKTAMIVSLDGKVGGVIAVADTVKPSA